MMFHSIKSTKKSPYDVKFYFRAFIQNIIDKSFYFFIKKNFFMFKSLNLKVIYFLTLVIFVFSIYLFLFQRLD
jgi:hypothetical protein